MKMMMMIFLGKKSVFVLVVYQTRLDNVAFYLPTGPSLVQDGYLPNCSANSYFNTFQLLQLILTLLSLISLTPLLFTFKMQLLKSQKSCLMDNDYLL